MNQRTNQPLFHAAFMRQGLLVCASILAVVAGCGSVDVQVPPTSGASHSATTDTSTGAGGTGVGGAGGSSSAGGAGGMVDCSTPQVTLLASGQSHPLPIAVDEATVYWLNRDDLSGGGGAYIMALPKSGGTPTEIAPMTEGTPQEVVVDESRIYWNARIGTWNPGKHVIYSVLKSGGPITQLYTSDVYLSGLTVDVERLYWFDNAGKIWSLPKGGGDKVLLGDGGSYMPSDKLVLNGDRLFWMTQSYMIARILKNGGDASFVPNAFSPVYGFVMDDASLFAITIPVAGTYDVVRVPQKTWKPTPFIKGESAVGQLAQSSECLYWITGNSGEIRAAPKAGGKPITILNDPAIGDFHFLADEAGVYWGDQTNGTLSKATK